MSPALTGSAVATHLTTSGAASAGVPADAAPAAGLPDLADVAAWLYVPAVRPERFAKAAAAADGVVVDLEDAVHPSRRVEARLLASEALREPLAVPVVVRVNPPGSADFGADIEAVTPLVESGVVAAVRVAKVDSVEDAELAAAATAHWGLGRRLICQLESARAVADARQIGAVTGVHSLMLGEADLRADLGLPRGASGEAGLVLARQQVVLAARSLGLPAPVGSAFTNVTDEAGLAATSAQLRSLGFYGRSCIHPAQVSVVRAAFAPGVDEIRWAQETMTAASRLGDAASAAGTLSDGTFVDPAIVRHAVAILARARTAEAS